MATAKRLKAELSMLQTAGFDVILDSATKWRVALRGGFIVINFPAGYPFVGFEVAASLSSKDIKVDVNDVIPRRDLSELLGFANEELHTWQIIPTNTRWNPQKTVAELLSREVPSNALWRDGKFSLHEHWQVVEDYFFKKLHPELFSHTIDDPSIFFEPSFVELVGRIRAENLTIESLLSTGELREECSDVYSIAVFRPNFCTKIIEEMNNYCSSGLPISRPNSMNNYGLIVDNIGMQPLISHLRDTYLLPLSRLLFPTEGSEFHSHHAFIVSYEPTKDVALDMHHDDSSVTWNVSLNGEFEGADLVFCGQRGSGDHRHIRLEYNHQIGRAVVHKGFHRHGANPIASGRRDNLIIWCTNDTFRQSAGYRTISRGDHDMPEESPPDPQCVSYTWDKDYVLYQEYPVSAGDPKKLFENAYYPFKSAEYPELASRTEEILQCVETSHERFMKAISDHP